MRQSETESHSTLLSDLGLSFPEHSFLLDRLLLCVLLFSSGIRKLTTVPSPASYPLAQYTPTHTHPTFLFICMYVPELMYVAHVALH